MIGAGARNRRAMIQRESLTSDGQGGQTASWAEVWRGRVKATPVAGKEALVAGTLRNEQPWRIEMLKRDVRLGDRIVAQGGWLPSGFVIDIESASDVEGDNQTIVIFGTARLAS